MLLCLSIGSKVIYNEFTIAFTIDYLTKIKYIFVIDTPKIGTQLDHVIKV